MSEEISPIDLDFLLRFPIKPHVTSPVDFLSNNSWGGICSLSARDEFRQVLLNIVIAFNFSFVSSFSSYYAVTLIVCEMQCKDKSN